MFKTQLKDLSVKPDAETLRTILNTEGQHRNSSWNAFWDIYTGGVTIAPNQASTYGVPIFRKGLEALDSLTLDDILLQFKAATWRRATHMFDYCHFRAQHDGMMLVRGLIRGWFTPAEIGQDNSAQALHCAVLHAEQQEIVNLVAVFSDSEMTRIMDQINAHYMDLFIVLDPTNTKHIMLGIAMLRRLAGDKIAPLDTASTIRFINGVIQAQANDQLSERAIDFVTEITQAGQRITWMTNSDTLFKLLSLGFEDVQAEIDFARDYWMMSEQAV